MRRRRSRQAPSRLIGGLRFRSGGDGHWYSECGRYAVFHMLRGTAEQSWELFTIDEKQFPREMIDTAWFLGVIIDHAESGNFSERRGWPHADASASKSETP